MRGQTLGWEWKEKKRVGEGTEDWEEERRRKRNRRWERRKGTEEEEKSIV